MEKIRIKYHNDKLTRINKITIGDWIDLRIADYVELKQGEYSLLNLGVSMELPKGYEAHVVPRSSTFKNFGIIQVNSPGIIDNSYCGDDDVWRFPALALRHTIIPFDSRICQFRIVANQPSIEFVEVQTLNNENRGGIGKTGIK